MTKFGSVWAGLTVALMLSCCSGCSLERHLTVGMVDTDRIVRENPQYMELNVLLMNEREAVYSQIPRDARNLPKDERESLKKKITKDANERSQRFDKLYRDFMKKLQTDIKSHAEAVAHDKGIDMVIINTPSYPTVLYCSGDSITTDILLKMKD